MLTAAEPAFIALAPNSHPSFNVTVDKPAIYRLETGQRRDLKPLGQAGVCAPERPRLVPCWAKLRGGGSAAGVDERMDPIGKLRLPWVTKTTAAEILANPATRRRQVTMTISLNSPRERRRFQSFQNRRTL